MQKIRVCILGNSHVGCINAAWSSLRAEYPLIEITFFADRGDRLKELRLENGALRPICSELKDSLVYTSGGLSSVQIDAYDLFVVVGLDFKPPILLKEYSSAVNSAASIGAWRSSINQKICSLLRESTQAPIFSSPNPLRAVKRRVESKSKYVDYKFAVDCMRRSIAEYDVHFFGQPEETVENWATSQTYAKNSYRLDIGSRATNQKHPPEDLNHMNVDYGLRWLSGFLKVASEISR